MPKFDDFFFLTLNEDFWLKWRILLVANDYTYHAKFKWLIENTDPDRIYLFDKKKRKKRSGI